MMRNVLSNWSAFLAQAMVAFFISPFLVRSLGDSAYGVWILLSSLVGYMGLLDLGVRGAVTRYIAKFHAEGDHGQAGTLAGSALVLFLASSVAAVGLAVLAAIFVVPAFQIPPDLVGEARAVVVLGGMTMSVSLISGLLEGIVIGRQRFDWMSGIDIASAGLRAFLLVVALKAGQGLVAMACIQLAIGFLRIATAYAVGRKVYPEIRIRVRGWDPHVVRLIFSFSIYSVLIGAFGNIINYTDSLVISSFLPVSTLTFFAIAGNLTVYARSIVSGVSFTVTPLTSALQAQGDVQELRRVVLKSARVASLVLLPIVITFMIRGSSFIGLWMGPAYAGPSGEVLLILAIGLSTQGGYSIASSAVIGVNRHRGLVPIFLFEALVNLGLSIWLVQRIGIAGVALGTAIPRLVVALTAMPWFLRRTFGIGIRSYWLNAWVRPMLAMVPFAVGSFVIESVSGAGNLTVFFLQVAGILPIAAAGAWFFSLTQDERITYRARVNGLRRGLRGS